MGARNWQGATDKVIAYTLAPYQVHRSTSRVKRLPVTLSVTVQT